MQQVYIYLAIAQSPTSKHYNYLTNLFYFLGFLKGGISGIHHHWNPLDRTRHLMAGAVLSLLDLWLAKD